MGLTRLSSTAGFMAAGLWACVAPRRLYSFDAALSALSAAERDEAERRAAYYCRAAVDPAAPGAVAAADVRLPLTGRRHTGYFFPLRQLLNYFPQDSRIVYEFGDVNFEPAVPTLVKSRPLDGVNGVLLPLNARRHFRWVTADPTPWNVKRDMLVGRNVVHHAPRMPFMERWFGNERTDLGQINDNGGRPDIWLMPRMSVDEQLRYKFIACIEGNDVATNLKWVMSSNSLPVMPPPRFETWFMEGTLQPGVNYVALKPDFSDLLEQMDHYLSRPDEVKAMVEANHAYVNRFRNPRLELATALLTLRNYLR